MQAGAAHPDCTKGDAGQHIKADAAGAGTVPTTAVVPQDCASKPFRKQAWQAKLFVCLATLRQSGWLLLLPCYPTSSTMGSYTIPCMAEQLCITQHAYSSRSWVELLLLKGLQPDH